MQFFSLLGSDWLDLAPEQAQRVASRALLMTGSGELPQAARIFLSPERGLWLQVDGGADAGPVTEANLQKLRLALHSPDDPAVLDASAVGIEDGQSADHAPLISRVAAVLLADPSWAGHVHREADAVGLVIAPADAEWALTVSPSPWREIVSMVTPVAYLDDEPAECLPRLKIALGLNDARVLGAGMFLVMHPDSGMLLLESRLSAAAASNQQLFSFLGRILLARSELAALVQRAHKIDDPMSDTPAPLAQAGAIRV